MKKMLTVTIDGIQVDVEEGATVLEAAQRAGVYIPTLCYHPCLPPIGACRLCAVEVEGMKGIHTACTLPCTDGMVVHTDTPAIKRFRQDILWLILSEHPHACLICEKRDECDLKTCEFDIPVEQRCCSKWNECELKEIVDAVGLPEDIPLPEYKSRGFPVIEDEPLIFIDRNLCILCERCIRACQDLRGIGAIGFIYRGRNSMTAPPPNMNLSESGCRFCCTCVEVCPSGALRDKVDFNGKPREEVIIACKYACPARIDVPRYVRLIAERRFAEALAVIRERVPFPGVLGRVCTHPCEDVCRREALNEPIAIRLLKRFVADYAEPTWKQRLIIAPSTGKRVAIIGAGPAGLTVGYHLRRLGHDVVIFDANPEPGGMMRVGIPEYRLPRDVLADEINEILSMGMQLHTGIKVESLDELFAQGFNAIFIGIGTQRPVRLGIEGEEHHCVIDGLSFLKRVNLGERFDIGKRIGVIGGGNVAIDAARVALRLGAEEVIILYRRTRTEMPALGEEIEAAIEEGVKIEFLVTPRRIIPQNNCIDVELIRMRLGAPDETGRRRPIPIEGSEFRMNFDTLIVAIGQTTDIPEGFGLELTQRGLIKVDQETLATSREGVFAGGDVVLGPSSVIEAIAQGRIAAESIDKFLGGTGEIDEQLTDEDKPDMWMGRIEGFAQLHKVTVRHLPPLQRKMNFEEVELGYTEEEAVAEAIRCLRCDLRFYLSPPLRTIICGGNS